MVAPQLAEEIVGLRWFAEHPDLLETGVTLFQLLQGTGAHRARLAQAAQLYDDIEAGSNATFDDALRLAAQNRTQLPTSFLQLRAVLVGWLTQLEVLMGVNHPLARSLSMMVRELRFNEERLDELFRDKPSFCGRLGLALQYKVYNWMVRQARETIEVPVPDLPLVLMLVLDHSWVPPPFSFEYQELWSQQQGTTAPEQHPATTTPQSNTTPTTPATTPAATTPPRNNTMERNPRLTPGVTIEANFNIRNLLAVRRANNVEQPRFNGTPVCLSYHKKGFCFDDCHRRATHRVLTADEATQLKTFLGDQA